MRRDPPWVSAGLSGLNFTVPGFVSIADLHGDIVDPQLVIFFSGNQFMVTHDLISAFQKYYPQYQRIYWETLPPGILIEQIKQSALVIGNLRLTIKPDILTDGQKSIQTLNQELGWFDRSEPYAGNRLAIMVGRNNPEGIVSLADLGRDNLRLSLPDPQWEGIGKLVEKSLSQMGGDQLVEKVMRTKLEAGTAFLTQIHHRQTPVRIMDGISDAGPVWHTEVLFQQQIGNPLDMVEIPEQYNQTSVMVAARLKNSPHARAAGDFLDYLIGSGKSIYRQYGFLSV